MIDGVGRINDPYPFGSKNFRKDGYKNEIAHLPKQLLDRLKSCLGLLLVAKLLELLKVKL